MLRPGNVGVKDMILQLDISMNDQENAALHAPKSCVVMNRKHALRPTT